MAELPASTNPTDRLKARHLAIIDASIPIALETIIDLAQNSENERTRLAAAQDLLNRAQITRAPDLANMGADMPARFIAMAMGGLVQMFQGRAVNMDELAASIEAEQQRPDMAQTSVEAEYELMDIGYKFEGERGTLADADKRPGASQTSRSRYVADSEEVLSALGTANAADRAALKRGILDSLDDETS